MHLSWFLRNLVWLFVIAALSFAARAGEDGAISVSISEANRMSVPLKVNGQETLSVIDTAATIALVDSNLVPMTETPLAGSELVVQGLSDTTIYYTTEVDLVEIGGQKLHSVSAGIVTDTDFPSHKTVIPISAFTQRVIDFDFEQGVIAVYDRRPVSPGRRAVSRVRYETIGGLIFVPITINGKRGRALIDTGADSSFINSKFADLANVRERPDLNKFLVGVDLEKTPLRIVSLRRVRIGDYLLEDHKLLASDPGLFKALGLEDEPVMLLGLNILRHFRVQIDREKKQVLLSRKG